MRLTIVSTIYNPLTHTKHTLSLVIFKEKKIPLDQKKKKKDKNAREEN